MFAINEDDSVTEFTDGKSLTGKRFKAVILTFNDVKNENRNWILNQALVHVCGSSDESIRHLLTQGALCTGLRTELDDGLGFAKKPPLGLIPRRSHEFAVGQKRISDIIEAMKRYNHADKPYPQEWFDELSELISLKV